MGNGLAISIRQATVDDAWFVYELRNDPDVRESSFNKNPLVWEQHLDWFKTRLEDSFIYLVEEDGEPVGYVRFEPEADGDSLETSVAILRRERGRGIGVEAIKLASKAAEAIGATRLVARIQPGNDASIRAFEAAGFSGSLHPGGDAMVLTRESGI